MNSFVTMVNENGSYCEMQIDGEIDALTQQWIDRHNPQRVEYRAAFRGANDEIFHLIEFDDVMDYYDEARANMRRIVAYRISTTNEAAQAEGHAINAVLAGYRNNWTIGRRNWLIARGYTNVPEPTKEPAPAGELDYDWG